MSHDSLNYSYVAPAVLPDGDGGFTPCPELLTAAEAVRYLRLDTVGHKNPVQTLRHYREQKRLRAAQIGRKLFYSRRELDRFIFESTNN